MKFVFILCAIGIIGSRAANLPSYVIPCSRSLPTAELTECVTKEARRIQSEFSEGIPEFGLEPVDPLVLEDIVADAGTFNIKTKNLILKGLKKMEIREVRLVPLFSKLQLDDGNHEELRELLKYIKQWNFEKNTGSMKLFGNMTFHGDYNIVGNLLIFPIKGNGKITVKCLNTDIVLKYKIRKNRDANGVEHLETYDIKQTESYGKVMFHLTNLPGGPVFGDTINMAMNDNWQEMIKQLGPPYTKATANKVHEVINKLYSNVPFDQLFAP